MNAYEFDFNGHRLAAHPDGTLYCQGARILVASDLHLGKSDRIARLGGTLLPPYETQETLARLDAAIERENPDVVICLGDSFDDVAAAHSLSTEEILWLTRLQAGRRWIWIFGNHDPASVPVGGEQLFEYRHGNLTFRHISAENDEAEISGHYHPKYRLRTKAAAITRPCFLIDAAKIIMPAFGAYTGGLHSHEPELSRLMSKKAVAVMTGSSKALAVPYSGVGGCGQAKTSD